MELKFIEHEETSENKVKYQWDSYTIGNYKVLREIVTYESGKTFERFEISATHEMDFLPEIYFNSRPFGNEEKGFRIQTTAYGSLSPTKIQELIDGYKEAIEVVNILTEQFMK